MPLAPPVTRATRLRPTMALMAELAALDWQVGPRAPFRPRAVVETFGRVADRFQRQSQNGRSHAGAARRDDRLVEIDAGRGEGLLDALARHQPAVFHHALERHVE